VVMVGEGLGSNTDESSGLLVGWHRADGFGFFELRNRGGRQMVGGSLK
jgi:hypothetical protein